MKTQSTIKPPESMFDIERTGSMKCNIHMYENVEEITVDGDSAYSYELYSLRDIPYHNRLSQNIEEQKELWLKKAKDRENAEPEYTAYQETEQNITDIMLDNIEQGQQITELELLLLGGDM